MKLVHSMLSALVALVVLHKVSALPQATTRLPFFPGGEPDDVLDDYYDSDDEEVSAVVVGTGPAGEPTYVITLHDDDDSDDDDWDDRPITATYVGDASRATVHVTYSDDDNDSLFGDDNDSVSGDDTDSNNGDDTDSDDDDGFHTHSIQCEIQNETAVCTYANIGRVNNQTTTSVVATRTRAARPITLVATTGTVPTASTTPAGSGTGTGAAATGSPSADTQSSGAQDNFASGAVVAGLSAAVAAMALV